MALPGHVRDWARKHYADPSDNDLEIPYHAGVSRAGDDGWWVEARVYVRDSDMEDK